MIKPFVIRLGIIISILVVIGVMMFRQSKRRADIEWEYILDSYKPITPEDEIFGKVSSINLPSHSRSDGLSVPVTINDSLKYFLLISFEVNNPSSSFQSKLDVGDKVFKAKGSDTLIVIKQNKEISYWIYDYESTQRIYNKQGR